MGAMKCATTTLHEQLERQPGLFMSHPKEPNFFSDDPVYARGFEWYSSLFRSARPGQVRGESSTHYTKLPTHPRTLERMRPVLPRVKLIYVMRHPIDRLVSHYIHERTVGSTTSDILTAIDEIPGLVDYGLYSLQLQPFLEAYGPENVLPVFFRRLVRSPQSELERIGRYLGARGPLRWDASLKPRNVGSERLRRSVVRDLLVRAPVLTPIRQHLIPKAWTEPIKALWRIRLEAPELSPEILELLRDRFDADLAQLGDWLGIELNCENFREAVEGPSHDWRPGI